MAAPDLPDLADLGKTPISNDAPTGADASYEPEYESMQREIDKLSIASESGAPTDWVLTANLAAGILLTKSKDLKVAAYLAEALARNEQIPGMATGVRILRDMVETFWDGLFPPKKRMRGRLNALSWWQDKAKAFLQAYDGDPQPQTLVQGLQDDLEALDKSLAEKTEDAPPLFPLVEAVKRLPVLAPEPEPEAEPAPQDQGAAPDRQAAPASSQARPQAQAQGSSQPAAPAGSAEEARRQLKSGLDQLFSASYALFKENPKDAVSYRLVRLAAWMPLGAPPPAKSGKTMIPPPPPTVRAALEQALAAGNFPAAIENAESHVSEFRFWLDLSRISAEGLRALGDDYLAARDALETESALFARRFPGVENLAFSDGTPFADEKTRLWLSRLGKSGGGSGQGAGQAGAEADEVEAVMDKARELEEKNQAVSAVMLLQDRLGSAKSGRLRLRWRIGMAEILLASGSPENARPIAEQILAELDEHRLDDFDPELALAGLLAARQGLSAAADEPAKAKAREILARIMRLNPAEGLKISGIR